MAKKVAILQYVVQCIALLHYAQSKNLWFVLPKEHGTELACYYT
jgi:hypothetical protein